MSRRHEGQDNGQATEFFVNIKPPGKQDLDKESLLFPDENSNFSPEYLELPIKVDGDLRPDHNCKEKEVNLPDSSFSGSQNMDNKENCDFNSEQLGEIKQVDHDLNELMNA